MNYDPGTADLIGLTAIEVAVCQAAGRSNEVVDVTSRSVRDIVTANVVTRFNVLLGSLFVIMLIVGSVKDAVFGVIVAANAVIGVVQEVRAKRTLDRLVVLSAPRAEVFRDGSVMEIAASQVVLGDAVRLRVGDQVVADGVVLMTEGVELDESLLTGESVPVRTQVGSPVRSGTVVVAGAGWFRAEAVGGDSYASRLAAAARIFHPATSELQDGINRVLSLVTRALVPVALMLLASQIVAGESLSAAVTAAVGGTVGMVPEGLVLLTSMAFAMSVIRLGRRNVLVQELPAVEGLARVDVVCFDKTGTLTDGGITVERITPVRSDDAEMVRGVLAALTGVLGANATARAISASLEGVGPASTTGAVPFSSTRKWASVTLAVTGETWFLGGADVVVSDDLPTPLGFNDDVGSGKRVLVLGRGGAPVGDRLPDGVEMAAIIVLEETIRPDAAATIGFFTAQGVAVKVISGDDPRTVAAIAAAVGVTDAASCVVDARTLPSDPDDFARAVEAGVVFGRTTPDQKQAMVRALQSRGHVVAMTGDGVNDVLALKAADIGVAMGHGAAAARAVGQVVLLDDTFSSLPFVLAEGRRVIGNIERVAALFLAKTCYVMLIAVATGVARLPFPFLPRHLSLISALTIGLPGFFLAFSPSQARYRPGLLRRCFLIAGPAGILAAGASFAAYAIALLEQDVDLKQARTSAALVLLTIGMWVVIMVARPLTRWRTALIGGLIGLGVIVLITPQTRRFYEFHLASGPILAGELALVVGALIIIEIVQRVTRRMVQSGRGGSVPFGTA